MSKIFISIDIEETHEGRRATVEARGTEVGCPLCRISVQDSVHDCLKLFTRAELAEMKRMGGGLGASND